RTLASLVLFLILLAARAAQGLTVVVTTDTAPVMIGDKTLATVKKGDSFEVVQQRDLWYGVYVKVEGKDRPVFGWLHSRNCEVKKAEGPGDNPLEAEADKELASRKAQADKLAAEGKWDEAVALFDKFPNRYYGTKAIKKAMQLGEEYDRKRREKPENVEASAEKEFKRRKAEADKLAAAGKLDEAVRLMEGFPGGLESSKWAEEAKKYALELQAKAGVSMADFEKKVLDLVKADKFDEALAEVKALEEKKLPGRENYLKFARAFVELQKKTASNPNAPPASDNGVGDVYANDTDFGRAFGGILNIRGPEGVTSFQGFTRQGDKIVPTTINFPKLPDQIAAGERLLKVYPWSPNVPYYLAKLYARAGETDKALESYASARTLDRGCTIVTLDSFIEGARVLARAKRFPLAVGLLKQALARKADDFVALTTLGRVHLAEGAKADAVAALEKSLKINPNQPEALRVLAEAKGQKPPDPPTAKLQLTELVKQVEESCVVVTATHSSGSGFVISSEGYVATNFHVIAPGGKLGVHTKRKGEKVSAPDVQLVLGDPASDIAILKCDPRVFPLKPLVLGAAKDAAAGEDVIVIGNPGLGGQILDYTVTRGIISNRDRAMNNLHYFQTDAAVNPGNSGGPLFNMAGQVIGMVTLKAMIERTGFALHIDHVKAHFPHCFPEME
ncbi:MAG: trypsin-like serine protease, partial [Planctomycetes bacterium]|nr:trypsin-like serine protease [Planctomycetota bacterium]